MKEPITLFSANTPNGWKIAMALEVLQFPYELLLVNLDKGEQRLPAFRAVNPYGKIPAISDPDGPDGNPITIFESGAILQYLGNKSGRLYGKTKRERIEVDVWLHWQIGNFGPIAGQSHHFLTDAPNFDPPVIEPYAQKRFYEAVAKLYTTLDERLEGREFLVGDELSISDIANLCWALRWPRQKQKMSKFPNVVRWIKALMEIPEIRRGRYLAEKPEIVAHDPAMEGIS